MSCKDCECENIKRQNQQLQEKLAVAERALELACIEIGDNNCRAGYCNHYGENECWSKSYSKLNCADIKSKEFLQQAAAELKAEKGERDAEM